MADMNNLSMTGRLVRDMECRLTDDYQIGNFSLAVDLPVKNGDSWEDQASFFDCVLYGMRVKGAASFMKKGKQINIVGHLRQDRWENDGQKRTRTIIVIEKVFPISDRKAPEKITEEEMEAMPW
jgi:single-strand DNA-binding protein